MHTHALILVLSWYFMMINKKKKNKHFAHLRVTVVLLLLLLRSPTFFPKQLNDSSVEPCGRIPDVRQECKISNRFFVYWELLHMACSRICLCAYITVVGGIVQLHFKLEQKWKIGCQWVVRAALFSYLISSFNL